MSPFTSLPEIRSFVAQNCSDNSKTIHDKTRLPPLSALPSWQKTGSWSWKSNDAIYLNSIKNERIKANIIQEEIQHQVSLCRSITNRKLFVKMIQFSRLKINFVQICLLLLNHHYNNVLPYK